MVATVAEYIAKKPRTIQPVLRRIRAVIRKAIPGADEVISYQIPTYKLAGKTVIYFAGWTGHVSLYPASGLPAKVLAKYQVSKGTLRFPLSEPLPVKLIERVSPPPCVTLLA